METYTNNSSRMTDMEFENSVVKELNRKIKLSNQLVGSKLISAPRVNIIRALVNVREICCRFPERDTIIFRADATKILGYATNYLGASSNIFNSFNRYKLMEISSVRNFTITERGFYLCNIENEQSDDYVNYLEDSINNVFLFRILSKTFKEEKIEPNVNIIKKLLDLQYRRNASCKYVANCYIDNYLYIKDFYKKMESK